MEDRLPRKLAAILYADIAGYSRLTGQDEDATHRTLGLLLDRLSQGIEEHNGQVMHYAGDAVLAKFDSVVDAVSSAVTVQRELFNQDHGVSDERRVQFRIGVNLGDVIEDRGDIYGDGVNVAARLESLAEPGGICISDAVRTAVGNKLGLSYEFLGEREVKNIAEPVRAYKVILEKQKSTGNSQDALSLEIHNKPSIAVLPFTNMSGDPEQEYFSDGITEDVITGLSKNPDLFVISRNSTFTYKGKSVRMADVGKELGARYVLEGSVRKAGRRVRVTAQLIDSASDRHLWVERYDRDLDDIFTVQDEVVGSIVSALGAVDGVLEKSARIRSTKSSVKDLTAYDYYLQGRHYFYQHGDTGFKEAEALYEKAIELDPDFARAYSALAWLHFLRFKLFRTQSFENIRQKTLDLALHSVRLDPNDYRAHWALGGLYVHEGKHAQSLAEFEKALHINPNDANLLAFSTQVLLYCGRTEEALERCERAIALNPNCPDWYFWMLGNSYFHLGQYQEALDAFGRMTAPQHARRLVAATYAHLDRLEEARAEAEEFMKVVPNFSIKEWAKTEPYTDPNELARYVDGLRKAGLPE
ncbi:MAG: tetratricopeptide repeat protein [Arenicellales bacterium]|nr:tetratricopeptide repeat protein [Arenicellales bacterium]